MLFVRGTRRPYSFIIGAIALLLSLPALAQERVVVGVVSDGELERLSGRQQLYTEELLALTGTEFEVEFKVFQGAGDKESVLQVIDAVYADAEVDLVLVTGFLSNQLAAIKSEYSKPTFLPVIVDTGLFATPAVDGTSGIHNLNYLSTYANFAADLETLARFVAYRKLVLFVDEELAGAIPQLQVSAYEASSQKGIELTLVTHDGVEHQLMERIPAGTDAVFVAGLPRMPPVDFQNFVDAINDAGLPSYSFAGVDDVERGLLVTDNEPRDIARQARLNALNMQAVLLGGLAEDQPIATQHKEQLTINMETARKINLSPSFDVLAEAVLLNREEQVTGDELGLVDIARLALAYNQDLKAESFGTQAGLEEISRARANLLPQLSASASYSLRKDSPSVAAGVFAERSTDAALNIDQLLYSDAALANLKIQKELQKTRLASLQQFRLDVVQAATTAYYAVLNARSQLAVQENNYRISKANLELAEMRVRLGTSTPADVYRWQAELARAQIIVLNSRATLDQLWDTLNRILHQPQGTRLALKEASFNEPFVMTRQEFDQLVESPADYARFSRFYIDRALQQAPELQQLTAQIAAKRRELVSEKRSYWLPDFTLGGRYTSNLDQSGLGAGLSAGQDLNDWSVGVQATLPLFSGGLKRANVSRASFELRQLEALRISTEERVEEEVRSQLHATQAAYAQIDLAAIAADASSKNFKLVSDAYARGTVTVIELLDAQDSSIAASAAAAESLYNFLTTIMAMQRAVGGFDFLLTAEERDGLAGEFRRTLSAPKR